MIYFENTPTRPTIAATTKAEIRAAGPSSFFRAGMWCRLFGVKSYEWDPTLTTADNDDTILIPDDIVFPAPGRWISTATGSQGAQGGPGAQGNQGGSGPQGSAGAQGAAGTPGGPQGSQGFQGHQGQQGFQGLQGVQGAQGLQGSVGVQGAQGLQGLQGVQGAQGLQGSIGLQGAQGLQGLQGAQGFQGFQGQQGFQGLQGAQGLQGVQGAQGFQGVSALGQITLSAAGAWTSFTSGAEGFQQIESTTNKQNDVIARFVTATLAYIEWEFPMPADYNGGTMTAVFYWQAPSASTNSVVWGIAARAFADNDSWDQAYGTAVEVTDANQGNGVINISAASSAFTPAGSPAAGQHMKFRIYRKGSGADNLAAYAYFIEARVTYTRQ